MRFEACMSGGVYALGSFSDAITSNYDFLSIGRNLTRTCRDASNKTHTGLGKALNPEFPQKIRAKLQFFLGSAE